MQNKRKRYARTCVLAGGKLRAGDGAPGISSDGRKISVCPVSPKRRPAHPAFWPWKRRCWQHLFLFLFIPSTPRVMLLLFSKRERKGSCTCSPELSLWAARIISLLNFGLLAEIWTVVVENLWAPAWIQRSRNLTSLTNWARDRLFQQLVLLCVQGASIDVAWPRACLVPMQKKKFAMQSY